MAKFDPKAKAKRQKIIAAVLGVLLLGVLVYEVPSVLKMMNKKPVATSPTAAPAPAPAPAAPGAAPTTATPVSAPASSTLVDSDPAAQAGSGQLVSFDRFQGKDPFVQQAGATPAAKPASTIAKPPAASTVTAQPKASKQPAAAPTLAKITVNGALSDVAVGQTFPASDPVFVLRSLTRTTAKIGIAGGSLATGNQTVTLTKGKKVTLMNTADGTRYELLLVSVA